MKKIRECLLIDDDLDDQEIFLMCLKSVNANISCRTVSTGVEAVSLLSSGDEYTPDFIFIDVNMPRMNGVECLALLKSIDHLEHSRFFMYSTTAETGTLARSRELGAEEFIIKPSKTSELKEKLSALFGTVSETPE